MSRLMRHAVVVVSLLVSACAGDLHARVDALAQTTEVRRTTSSGLRLGPHPVGFKVVTLPSDAGRLFVWRPVTRAGPTLTLGSFAEAVCPGRASELAACFPNLGGGSGGSARSSTLRHMALHSSLGGRPQRGRHRLVLLMGSIDSRGAELLGVAEALASRGYIVAEIVPPPRDTRRTFDVVTAEASANRAAVALRHLTGAGGVDTTQVGIVAWSFGGVAAAISAARDKRVVAVVSLDSALRYEYGTALLTAADIPPASIGASVYAVSAGVENSVAKDDRLIAALPHVSARVVGAALSHADLCDHYGAWAAHADGASAQAQFGAHYRTAVEPALTFLDRALAQ